MYKPPTSGGLVGTAGAFAATTGTGWWVALGLVTAAVSLVLLHGSLRRGRAQRAGR